MGLAAFSEKVPSNQDPILSVMDNGELKLKYQLLNKIFKEPNVFGKDLSSSRHHQTVALQVQVETEAVLLKLLNMLHEKYPTDNLYLCGGVALNVVLTSVSKIVTYLKMLF